MKEENLDLLMLKHREALKFQRFIYEQGLNPQFCVTQLDGENVENKEQLMESTNAFINVPIPDAFKCDKKWMIRKKWKFNLQ